MSAARNLAITLLALAPLMACGSQDEGLPESPDNTGAPDDGLESDSSAVISGASRGSTIRAVEGVYLRTGPDTSYPWILLVPAGKTATVLNATPSNGFYKINYQGNVGWSHGNYWNVIAGLYVNNWRLEPNEEKWVRWIAEKTVPRLRAGGYTRDRSLTTVSRVGWWSLKEGLLLQDNPFVFSSCYDPYLDQDYPLGPSQTCPYTTWQVGLSGIQVNNVTSTVAEDTMKLLYPGQTVAAVLGQTAVTAGYASGTSTYNAIVNSTGSLRRSWVLRNHGTGFRLQESFVTDQCITGSDYWCYTTAWYPSNRYSPDKTEALESIRELKAIFDGLAPL